MISETHPLAPYLMTAGPVHYPANCVVGILTEEQAVEVIRAALDGTTSHDDIRVLPAARRDDFELRLTGGGLRGFAERVISSTGGDLDLYREWHAALEPGTVWLSVRTDRHHESHRQIAHLMREQSATMVHHLGRLAVESLECELPNRTSHPQR